MAFCHGSQRRLISPKSASRELTYNVDLWKYCQIDHCDREKSDQPWLHTTVAWKVFQNTDDWILYILISLVGAVRLLNSFSHDSRVLPWLRIINTEHVFGVEIFQGKGAIPMCNGHKIINLATLSCMGPY